MSVFSPHTGKYGLGKTPYLNTFHAVPVTVGSFWSTNYIEYECNGDINKTLSVEEYLHKVRPYLKDIINDFKKCGTWKIQLTIAINSQRK